MANSFLSSHDQIWAFTGFRRVDRFLFGCCCALLTTGNSDLNSRAFRRALDGLPTMSNNKSFFEAPQAAAIYKHELLKRYIAAWVGKVGSTSTDRRVVVYDA
jgi:hypothetical protein